MATDDGGEETHPQLSPLDEMIIREHEDSFDEDDPFRGLFDPEHDLDEDDDFLVEEEHE